MGGKDTGMWSNERQRPLAELPVGLAQNPRSVGIWESVVAAVNLFFLCPGLSPVLYSVGDWGHQSYGLDAPCQDVFKRSGPIFESGP